MTAIREQILAHMFAQLQTLAPGIAVYRDQGYDVPIAKGGKAISLEDGGDTSVDDQSCFGCTFKTMDVVLQLRVSSATPAAVSGDLSALVVAIYPLLITDFSQGGKAIDTHDGGLSPLEKPSSETLPNLGAAEWRIPVDYQHATGRPDLLFSP